MPDSAPSAPEALAPRKPASLADSGFKPWTLWLILVGFLPLASVFFSNLWLAPQYQFFPFALAGIGVICRARFKDLEGPLSAGNPASAAAGLGFSFALLVAATFLWSPWIAAVSAVFGAAAVFYWIGSGRLLRAMLPGLVLLVTLIPPPGSLDERFTILLRKVAVVASSRLLDVFGVIHVLAGNIIELPGQRLLVEEACSGINSVVFVTFACLFYLFWKRRPFYYFLVSLPLMVCFVLLGNVVRITSGAWLLWALKINILSGWKHELVGLILFASYLILIVSLDHLLTVPALAGAKQARKAPPAPDQGPELPRSAPGWVGMAGCAFGLLGLVQTGVAVQHLLKPKGVTPSQVASIGQIGFEMPVQLGSWVSVAEAAEGAARVELLGKFSKTWQFRQGNLIASVAVDYPFVGYHDVANCYTSAGWVINGRKTVDRGGSRAPIDQVAMFQEGLSHATLMFGCADGNGVWVRRPGELADRWKAFAGEQPTSYQLQVLVRGSVPLAPDDLELQRELFWEAGRALSAYLAKAKGGAQ